MPCEQEERNVTESIKDYSWCAQDIYKGEKLKRIVRVPSLSRFQCPQIPILPCFAADINWTINPILILTADEDWTEVVCFRGDCGICDGLPLSSLPLPAMLLGWGTLLGERFCTVALRGEAAVGEDLDGEGEGEKDFAGEALLEDTFVREEVELEEEYLVGEAVVGEEYLVGEAVVVEEDLEGDEEDCEGREDLLWRCGDTLC